jgi:hypothetical protein
LAWIYDQTADLTQPQMAEQNEQKLIDEFFNNEEQKRIYKTALAEIEPDLEKIETELDDCQRLTEEDFVVRINARD